MLWSLAATSGVIMSLGCLPCFIFGAFINGWTVSPCVSHDIDRGVLLGVGPRTTFSAGATVRSGYIRGSGFLALITFLYPIAWAVSEGGNVISPNKEMVFYGILDLILGPVFLYYYLFGLRDIDYGTYGIHSGKFSDGPATGEKGPAVAAASNYPTSAARTEPGTTAAAPQAVGTAAPAV